MKRLAARFHWPRMRSQFRRVLVTGRAYFVLSFCSMAVFVLLGLAGMLQNAVAASPVQSMKGFAASVSGQFFESLLGLELPHMKTDPHASPLQAGKMAAFLFRFITDLNPGDPKSMLALELPGSNTERSVLLQSGSGGGDSVPEDHGPVPGQAGDTQVAPDSRDQTQPPSSPSEPSPDPTGGVTPPPNDNAGQSPSEQHGRTTGSRKIVFIYHSHNRESFFPELGPGVKDANSDKINVTQVGKRLAVRLEAAGIGAAQSDQDYATAKGYNWNFSYKYSLQTVRQAVADNSSLKFFFDIHRDSQRRSKTTATIRGVDYAQVYFIIGHRNPSWKKNEAFASQINERLEKSYPGLSRGIWGKTAATGNGEYNQSVSPDSVLIEVGGIDNTLRECYRTADALAEVIADLYWENQKAVKVNGNPSD